MNARVYLRLGSISELRYNSGPFRSFGMNRLLLGVSILFGLSQGFGTVRVRLGVPIRFGSISELQYESTPRSFDTIRLRLRASVRFGFVSRASARGPMNRVISPDLKIQHNLARLLIIK